jgi:hypothetical protein
MPTRSRWRKSGSIDNHQDRVKKLLCGRKLLLVYSKPVFGLKSMASCCSRRPLRRFAVWERGVSVPMQLSF